MSSRIHLARQGLITKNKPTITNIQYTNTTSVAGLLLYVNPSNTISDGSINNWATSVVNCTTSTTQTRNGEVSIRYDGTGDYVNFTTANQAAVAIGTKDYTVDTWIWPDSTLTAGAILGSLTFGSTTNWWFSFVSGSPLGLVWYNGVTAWQPSVGSAITGNDWNHIAVTRKGSTQTIWINGVQAGTQTNSTNIANTLNLSAGADSNGETGALFKGYVNRTRLIVGAALYETNFTPPTSLTTSSLQIITGGPTSTYGSYLLA
jgi:hypothetical protein